jgi:hypothetical protein
LLLNVLVWFVTFVGVTQVKTTHQYVTTRLSLRISSPNSRTAKVHLGHSILLTDQAINPLLDILYTFSILGKGVCIRTSIAIECIKLLLSALLACSSLAFGRLFNDFEGYFGTLRRF